MKWISVKDRLPDTIGDNIIYIKNRNIIAWAFFNSNKRWVDFVQNTFWEDVTHWMPLPDPPEV